MAILADVGIVSYNGYQFDGASHVSIRCEPVPDEAQRTVVYHRYLVSVKTIVAGEAGTGLEMAAIRALLTKQGQALIVYNKGFYDLIVNSPGSTNNVSDVAFGPKPRIVSWTPIGSLYACEVEWECETCIAYCAGPKLHSGVMAHNYELTYALDYRGRTTRTITGYLEIAMTRQGDSAIPNTADAYRTQISPAIPQRFNRTAQSYSLSKDKRRLDYTIVDTELPSPNPWPLGIVNIDARHQVGWARRGGMAGRLRNRITVDVEVSPDYPMLQAYAAFSFVAKSRIDVAKAAYNDGVLIESVDCEENIFDRTCSFSVVYTIYTSLQTLLTSTGLWTPINANTWDQWAYSLIGVRDQRGYANMQHLAANDAIVDPCTASVTIPWDASYTPDEEEAGAGTELLKNETPAAEKSWLEYVSHVYINRGRAMVRQAVLQEPEEEDADYTQQATDNLTYGTSGGIDDIMQRSGRSRYTAVLQGRALRAGHPIPRPSLTSIGSAAATEIDGDYVQRLAGNWLGVPIYSAHWRIVYALENAPGEVQPIANIKEGIDTDGTAEAPTGV